MGPNFSSHVLNIGLESNKIREIHVKQSKPLHCMLTAQNAFRILSNTARIANYLLVILLQSRTQVVETNAFYVKKRCLSCH